MFHSSIRHGSILLLVGLLAIGCTAAPSVAPANTNNSSPVAAPTSAASAPTVSPAPTQAAASSGASTTIRLVAVPNQSEARYRVREQLAGVSLPSDAIGRTKSITGTIVGKTDGTIVAGESKFSVDLQTLASNESRRDNFLRNNVLQTSQYPNAVFVPTATQGLPLTLPPAGPVSFKLLGDLTIRNVTKSVTWDVNCEPQGNQGICHATTSFPFEFMELTQPRVPLVLSIQNNITLEVDLALQRQVD